MANSHCSIRYYYMSNQSNKEFIPTECSLFYYILLDISIACENMDMSWSGGLCTL